jgi:TIR domain
MPTSKFDIFLSYKSDDSDLVERLKRELIERGVRVWLDKDQIRPGDIFAEALADGIENSRSVGLVVTPKSMTSNWVKNEYFRALGLATHGQLQLIPLLFRDADLPGFLSDRQYVDFRNESEYQRRVEQVIWPGITGKRLCVFAINGLGSFPWDWLRNEVEKLGHVIRASDYVETAPHEIYHTLAEGYRVVAIVDPFEGFRSPKAYVESIFEIREKTKGTRDEVVFVLYQHPDALLKASHGLSQKVVTRLSHYFMIHTKFNDTYMNRDGDKPPTDSEREELHRSFGDVWMRVNRELLKGDVRSTSDFKFSP